MKTKLKTTALPDGQRMSVSTGFHANVEKIPGHKYSCTCVEVHVETPTRWWAFIVNHDAVGGGAQATPHLTRWAAMRTVKRFYASQQF
jgi:hypothetical protein